MTIAGLSSKSCYQARIPVCTVQTRFQYSIIIDLQQVPITWASSLPSTVPATAPAARRASSVTDWWGVHSVSLRQTVRIIAAAASPSIHPSVGPASQPASQSRSPGHTGSAPSLVAIGHIHLTIELYLASQDRQTRSDKQTNRHPDTQTHG